MEAFFFLDLYQNDIVPDLADTFPGYDIFAVSSKKAAKSPRPGYDQCCETACSTIKFHINGTSQAAAVTDIDDFLLL